MSQFEDDRDAYAIDQWANQAKAYLRHKKAAAEAGRIRNYNTWSNCLRRHLAQRLLRIAIYVQPDLTIDD